MPITAEGADLEIVRKVNDIIEQYEAAARQLRELSRKPQVDGITGYHEFPSLAEVARLLRDPPKTPLSPNQEDALLRLSLGTNYEPAAVAVASRAGEVAKQTLGIQNVGCL
ncbi:unnamed protein product [Durusdinium trenchii]|uniref:Uncharacterized protein n=1 Tax=Durusdinium trenchii TaxID=1381693 RepID=A0ABP0J4J4_9DINO